MADIYPVLSDNSPKHNEWPPCPYTPRTPVSNPEDDADQSWYREAPQVESATAPTSPSTDIPVMTAEND